jgi:putative flippase GtrA
MNKSTIHVKFLELIKHDTFNQIVKYFVVGGVCTILDFLLLYVLTKYFSLHYVVSSILSFMSGTLLNYYMCTFWIFKVRVVENRKMELLYYAIITGVGLGINTLLIWGLTETFSLFYMTSKIMATFVTFWWNFGARKYFLHTIK